MTKEFYVSPFNAVDGYYLVRAPRPDESRHDDLAAPRAPADFVATLRGTRRPATSDQLLASNWSLRWRR